MNLRMLSIFFLIALILTACGTGAGTPTPLPTVALDSAGSASQASFGSVTASGSIVPAQEAQVVFALAGEVEAVYVRVGDQVEAGQSLARLAGREALTAAVETANLEVLNARQALKDLQASAATTTAEAQLAVAQAQAAVVNARTNLDDAQRRLKALNYPDLEWYQDQVDEARGALLTAQENAEIIDIGSLQAALQAARDARDKLKERLDKVRAAVEACSTCDAGGSFTVDGIPQTLADAQDNYNGAVNRVTELELQIAQARRGNSQAIADAQQTYDDAAENLAAAQRGPKPADVETAEADVAVAGANLAVAEAALSAAQVRYARVEAGPDPEQLALAQARLTAAEAQLAAAKSTLDDLELRAPFGGTVAALHAHEGEWVAPGQLVLLLSDLQQMNVETIDLSERDIPKVKAGQPVTVFIEALNEEVAGHVIEIAPLADTLGGDVVYKTTIALETLPAGLRAGMSVEVQIATGQ